TGGAVGNVFLIASLAFAFATLYPSHEILVFFVLPVQVKWLGWVIFAFVVYQFVEGDLPPRGAVLGSFADYVVFFFPAMLGMARGQRVQWEQASKRASQRPSPVPAAQARACAICGAKEVDGADIRVCSCEKCKEANAGQARTLCLEHARKH